MGRRHQQRGVFFCAQQSVQIGECSFLSFGVPSFSRTPRLRSRGPETGRGCFASKQGREPIRPTAPARLPAEKITLYGFIWYIKLHVQRHYLESISSSASEQDHNGTTATTAAVGPPSSPSPFGVSDLSTTADAGIEIAVPFSLPQLKANKQLSIFATRLAQEQARLKEQARVEKLENAHKWGSLGLAGRGAMGGGGGGRGVDETPTKGQAWVGENPYLRRDATPAVDYGLPSTSSKPQELRLRHRRERRRCDTILFWQEAGPLYDDELADAVGKVWRTAIRTMRSWGMIIEYAEPAPAPVRTSAWREADLPQQLDGTDELPDLPRHEERSTTVLRTPRKRTSPAATPVASNCPWGDVRLQGSSDDEEGNDFRGAAASTPRAVKKSKLVDDRKEEAEGPAPGCPWGDVKLFDDEDDPEDPTTPMRAAARSSRQPGTPKRFSPTERPIRSPSPEFELPLPPSAQRPSSPAAAARVKRSPSSYSDCSDTSIMTTGSLADDDDGAETRAAPPPQRFQLVTAASLCPLMEHLVKSIYATDTRLTSVSEADVRKHMYLDSQWEAVGRHGDQVTEALDLLCLDGVLQRHGQGFRPTHRW